jgi:RNA polymerase sigma-70 factor (ECF subfamily)
MSVKGVSLTYLAASEESELIEAAQAGDREGYLRLVRHYERPVYRAAYSMSRDPAQAEALTRDVFVHAWRRLHDFPRGQRFFPWLLRVARGLFPTPQAVPASGEIGDPETHRSAKPNPALAAFAELRPDEQMALSLRLLERIPYEEIAGILDLTLGVVTLRLSQARGHLLPHAEALPRESA